MKFDSEEKGSKLPEIRTTSNVKTVDTERGGGVPVQFTSFVNLILLYLHAIFI